MRRVYLIITFVALLGGAFTSDLFSGRASGSYRVVHGWPQLPPGFTFGQVSGVGVDSRNHVFVLHRAEPPVMCFDGETGKLLYSFGDGMLPQPHGMTVDSHDNVWVTDIGHHQIFKFSDSGKLLMTVGSEGLVSAISRSTQRQSGKLLSKFGNTGRPGLDGALFDKPTDVAVTPGGEFYVADGYGNSRVAKFSDRGEFLFDWGERGDGPGQFDTPHGIALDAEGRVYVADRGNSRIQVFTADGKFLDQWKSEELGRPWGLSFGPDNLLYVVDGGDMHLKPPERNHALKLDLEGRILEKWGRFGSYDGQFYWAHDVAVGPQGEVYVADVNVGMRVQKFVRE